MGGVGVGGVLVIDIKALQLGMAGLVRVPVSYTHLRAHETVLDLVCRLLLEKKNKYNYPIKLVIAILII